MSLKWKIICTAAALAFSAIFIYPTFRWISMSPERRGSLQDQWDADEPVPRGSMRYYARAVKRWAQGDRERVINLGLDLQGGVHLLYEIDFPTEMDAKQKDVEQRAIMECKDLIEFLLDPLKGLRQQKKFAAHNKRMERTVKGTPKRE